MSKTQKLPQYIVRLYSKINLKVALPLLLLSMFMSGFGWNIIYVLKALPFNFKIFADNILSTGYGCGTYGQSEPNYGSACTTATSIILLGSSSILSSSSNLASSSLVNVSSLSNSVASVSVVNSSSATSVISSMSPSSSNSSALTLGTPVNNLSDPIIGISGIDLFPIIYLTGSNLPDGTFATFKTPIAGTGSGSIVNGTIVGGNFVPNVNSKIPTNAAAGQLAGTLSAAGLFISIPTKFTLPQSISSSSVITSSQSSQIATTPTLSVKVNLSANYNNSTKQMENSFRIRNMIPISQPYNQSPFNYLGTETYNNITSIPADAVDWVIVEIKDVNKNSVFTKATILKQNGNVVDVSGLQNMDLNGFVPIQGYNYQIVVRHRNAIAIATNQNITFLSNNNTNVDFTKNINVKASNQEQIGTDIQNQSVFGMRRANSNGSDTIDAQDRSVVLSTQESDGIYNPLDLNLDGTIDAQDRSISLATQEASENI
jgi:hypothetical protein